MANLRVSAFLFVFIIPIAHAEDFQLGEVPTLSLEVYRGPELPEYLESDGVQGREVFIDQLGSYPRGPGRIHAAIPVSERDRKPFVGEDYSDVQSCPDCYEPNGSRPARGQFLGWRKVEKTVQVPVDFETKKIEVWEPVLSGSTENR